MTARLQEARVTHGVVPAKRALASASRDPYAVSYD
jgi:hypothetical protein